MAALTGIAMVLLVVILIFLIAALPLHIAVKMMGGKTTLFRTAFISAIAGVVVYIVKSMLTEWGGLIAFIAMLFIYMTAFKIGFFKALVAWFLQFIVAIGLILILGVLGITVAGLAIAL